MQSARRGDTPADDPAADPEFKYIAIAPYVEFGVQLAVYGIRGELTAAQISILQGASRFPHRMLQARVILGLTEFAECRNPRSQSIAEKVRGDVLAKDRVRFICNAPEYPVRTFAIG